MPQSLASLHIHLVFSTKNREPVITDVIRPHLHAYMATVLQILGATPVLINSVESESNVESVHTYVANQREHHRKKTFQDEYRQFLDRHRIPFDEKYVWD